jgi:hypothetical protein
MVSINLKSDDDHDDDDDEEEKKKGGGAGKIWSNREPSTPRADKCYCNEATQSGPCSNSQCHQTQNMPKNTEIKQRAAVKGKETREIMQKDKHVRKAGSKELQKTATLSTAHMRCEVFK